MADGKVRLQDGAQLLHTDGKLAIHDDCCCESWEIRDCPYTGTPIYRTSSDLTAYIGDVIRFTANGGSQQCGVCFGVVREPADGSVIVVVQGGYAECGPCIADIP